MMFVFSSDGNSCIECVEMEFLELNNFTGKCECIKGYKLNKGSCQRCYEYYGECLLECPLYTESDKENFVCKQIELLSSDNTVLIYFCGIIIGLLYCLGSFCSGYSSKVNPSLREK